MKDGSELSSCGSWGTWPSKVGSPLEFQPLCSNLLFLIYPLNVAGTKIQTYMASVHILSLVCCCLSSLWKFFPVLMQLGHTTTPTLNNCQVLIYSCTHTITNANIQHSSIMKPKYFRSYSNLIDKYNSQQEKEHEEPKCRQESRKLYTP